MDDDASSNSPPSPSPSSPSSPPPPQPPPTITFYSPFSRKSLATRDKNSDYSLLWHVPINRRTLQRELPIDDFSIDFSYLSTSTIATSTSTSPSTSGFCLGLYLYFYFGLGLYFFFFSCLFLCDHSFMFFASLEAIEYLICSMNSD